MYFDPNTSGKLVGAIQTTFIRCTCMCACIRRLDNFDSSFHVSPSCSKRISGTACVR